MIETAIRRHVLAIMLNAVLVLLGLIAYDRIGVDRLPYIEFPTISVTTIQRGANPDVVDASITSVVETAVNSVPGIELVTSTSTPGTSQVTIQFELNKDIDSAYAEVQSKVNRVLRQLPTDIDPPIIRKVESNAQPILWLSLQGDRTQQQLNQYALNVVKKQLETIDGVGEVRLGGRRDRTIRVELDPARMAAYAITPAEVAAAVRREHLQAPAGFLVEGDTEQLLKLDLEFHSTDALERLVVATRDGARIRLADIARVEDGLADFRSLARFNAEPSVGVGVVKIANTNSVAIIDAVKQRVDAQIRPNLPPGMRISIANDDSAVILEIVNALKEHLVEGTLLAALVVLLFLRSLRSTLIVATAIPVSLMGAVAVMYFAGFTFNAFTLLALLLLIGVVVDDAIVVLENIARRREKLGEDAMTAASRGTREVVFAVVAATLSLVAIFGPVVFIGGVVGRFFASFAVVVSLGVLASLFVSLTLTPVLCSRFMQPPGEGRVTRWLGTAFDSMEAGYRRLLQWSLRHRWWVIGLVLLAALLSAAAFTRIGKAFAPDEDESRFIVNLRTPLGSSIEYTDARLREVEAIIRAQPEVTGLFAAIGLGDAGQVNRAFMIVRLQPRHERSVPQQDVIARLRGELAGVAGASAFPSPPSLVPGMRGDPLQFSVLGNRLDEVERVGIALRERLAQDPAMGSIDLDLQLDLPQLRVEVDRERAAMAGLSADEIGTAFNIMVGGLDVAKFNDSPGDGQRYNVRLKGDERQFRSAADIGRIFLRTPQGDLVRLDSVARLEREAGAAVITRLDGRFAASFYSTPLMPLGNAVDRVREVAAEVLPPDFTVRFTGQADEFGKTMRSMGFAFALALVLLYMVLASQFNSFVQPLYVMFAQPLAMIGGVLALWLTGHTLNIFSLIGLLLLIGLVAKNAILLIDLTNQRRAQGMAIDEALLDACPIRLRPLLMTSLTVVLAMLPAALGLAAGSASNAPLAVAVIGGMLSSTLLTLVVVPAVYSLLERWLAGRKRRPV